MKKYKLTKVIASSLIAISVVALSPIAAKAEWRQDSTGWWYSDGSSYATGTKTINGKEYYFNPSGYMATGGKRLMVVGDTMIIMAILKQAGCNTETNYIT